MDSPFLLVGLGNPGKKYFDTKHNTGFMVVDQIGAKLKIQSAANKNNCWIGRSEYLSHELILLKPLTYMNLSGVAVQEVYESFSINLQQLLIIYDDFNIPFGKLRLRAKGSDGGHKGLASVIYHLQTQNFPRLRIGIGAPLEKEQVVDYVLSPFNSEEKPKLPEIIDRAVEASFSFITNGIGFAMNQFNSLS
jgi:PTH1 family peptidyl-tRNA hydrolase